jgi:SAM-dependent methyltransferase
MNDEIAKDVQDEQRIWSDAGSFKFFSASRNSPEDLYPSERRFLPELVAQVRTVLDVGCAAGGFSRIMKSFNPSLEYTGIDVNPEFVALASARYPDSRFEVGDGIHFRTPPNSYELVHSSGILHLNSRYEDIVRGCYAQASRNLLCDFRLTRGPRVEGTLTLDFDADGRARPPLPYIVVNVDELLAMLGRLQPAPAAIRMHGYFHEPSHMASIPLTKVIMSFVVIEKGNGSGVTTCDLDLPRQNN